MTVYACPCVNGGQKTSGVPLYHSLLYSLERWFQNLELGWKSESPSDPSDSVLYSAGVTDTTVTHAFYIGR